MNLRLRRGQCARSAKLGVKKTRKLKTLDLFSGIGGFSLGFRKFATTVAYCDNDKATREVVTRKMKKRQLDEAPIFEDVQTLRASNVGTSVDLVTAGFPCQDISWAGKRAGLAKGARSSLVKEVVRLLGEFGRLGGVPSYVFLENVGGITREKDEYKNLVSSLDKVGYDVAWDYYTASSCGALHHRRRWFLLGMRRSPAPVPVQFRCDHQLEELVSKDPFRFKGSAILPAFHPEHAAAKQQAMASMAMLGNAVVPAQANKAFRGLYARMERLRQMQGAHLAGTDANLAIPVPGAYVGGVLQKLEADADNREPGTHSGRFQYHIKAPARRERAYQNTTPLRTGKFSLDYMGTPRRAHARASAPTNRAFGDFGTTVAFCEAFAKGVDPRSATVKHEFCEVAMGFPRGWTHDPTILQK